MKIRESLQGQPDQILISRYLTGDQQALEVLIARHLKSVFAFAYQYAPNKPDAEDITQDTFVKAWKHIKKFDQRKNFKTWLLSIAKNTALDLLKKKKAIPFSNFENGEGENTLTETLADIAPLPNEILERADITHILSEALEQISVQQRIVLILHYTDGLTFREIAESLGEPLHTIKSRHYRGVIALQQLLSESTDKKHVQS